MVDQQQERGADFIKVYNRLSRETYFAIADESKRRGIPFAGHVPESVTAAEASDAGQKSFEHLRGVAAGCSREEKTILEQIRSLNAQFDAPNVTAAEKMTLGSQILRQQARIFETYDEGLAQSLIARFIKNGTWQCPTLTVLRAVADDTPPLNDPKVKYLSKDVRSSWEPDFYKGFPEEARKAVIGLAKMQFEESKRLVNLMYRARVNILAGTDALNPECFPGFSLHDELALLVDSGLPPLAALQAATRNAAQFMGQLERRGTIEAGKTADLVLLGKDPLADIHNTRSIEAVVLNGKLIPRAALDSMLAEAEALNR